MYVFQFMDATWRIDRLTNTRFPLPMRFDARKLFDGVYHSESDARLAMKQIQELAVSDPFQFHWR